jgi:hypothetical protein
MHGRASCLKSEYQRSFRPELFVCSSTTYSNNRAIRTNLKSRCQSHSHDPFVWEDYEDFDSEFDDPSGVDEVENCEIVGGTGDAGVDRRRPLFVPAHRFKHEMWKRLYEKRLQRQFGQKEVQTDAEQNPDKRDCSCETDLDSSLHEDDNDDEAVVVHVVNGAMLFFLFQ